MNRNRWGIIHSSLPLFPCSASSAFLLFRQHSVVPRGSASSWLLCAPPTSPHTRFSCAVTIRTSPHGPQVCFSLFHFCPPPLTPHILWRLRRWKALPSVLRSRGCQAGECFHRRQVEGICCSCFLEEVMPAFPVFHSSP